MNAEGFDEKRTCFFCRFVKVARDRKDPDRDPLGWTAYECANSNSPFFGALLNVSLDGRKLAVVSWIGCKHFQEIIYKDHMERMRENAKSNHA